MFRFGKAKASRKERLRLKAMKTRHRAAEAAYKAQAMAGPTVEKAGNAIAPKVSAARDKVTDDLVPLALAIMASAAERSRQHGRLQGAQCRNAGPLGRVHRAGEARKSTGYATHALAMGGLSTRRNGSLAATKRSRGPEWMNNGSEEPYATAAQPEATSRLRLRRQSGSNHQAGEFAVLIGLGVAARCRSRAPAAKRQTTGRRLPGRDHRRQGRDDFGTDRQD